VGFLETNPFFYPRTTGREYLELFRLANRAFDVEGWNRLFALPLDRLIDHYSTGMRKKLAFLGWSASTGPWSFSTSPTMA
jgi:ABC-2 type transport system ATP-binding protein